MKDNHKTLKRFLALVLSAAIVLTYMPTSLMAYAEGESGEPAATEEVAQEAPAEETTAPEAAESETPAPVAEDPAPTDEPAPAEEQTTPEASVPEEPTSGTPPDEAAAEEPAETPEATEVTEEPAPEEEEAFPAQTFNADKGGVKVLVKAPEGALPEGTEMVVKPANTNAVEQAVKDAVDGEVTGFKAVDITFVKDGEEKQPLVPVHVYLNASGLDKAADKAVVHIPDEGAAEIIEDATVNKAGIATVVTDQFSIYAIVSSDNPAVATYEFYVDGEMVRSQKVIKGDNLYEPDTPVSDSGKFLGWFAGDTEITFTDGIMTVGDVAANSTVRVDAKFGSYYYATFRDQDDNIVSRVEVAAGEKLTAENKPADITPKASNEHFAGWTTEKGGKTAVTFPYEMTGNVTFYPIIEIGHWVHYDANRSHVEGMENVNVSYTSPEFVLEGGKAKQPANPTAELAVYTFEGWYTDPDCTQKYNFNNTVTSDLTLYANWNIGQAKYNVVIWQQQVTDDKSATGDARKWDYYESFEYSADIGSTVTYASLPATVRNLAFTGFTRDHYDESIKVVADGSSTLNVYYRRNLMTINFYVYNGRNGWSFGTNAWEYRNYSQVQVWRTITGLYGATFAQSVSTGDTASDYVWPAQYTWTDGSINQTLLNAFTETTTPKNYYCKGESGDNAIHHVRQKADGTWPTAAELSSNESVAYGSGGNFHVSQKFSEFMPVAYSKQTYRDTETGRIATTVGGEINSSGAYPLYIYHARNSYNVEFYDGTVMKDHVSKLYEASLADLADKKLEPTDPAKYSFGGWSLTPGSHSASDAVDLTKMTMQARTLKLYAIWVNVAYNVKLDLGASDAQMNSAQSRDFWPVYGATIDDTYMSKATRPGHVLVGWFDPDGNPWDFGNGITKELCDEGPIHDAQYNNDYYVLHLTAKWRLDKSINVEYDLNGGSGTFVDNENYLEYGSFQVLDGTPTAPDTNHVFTGWADKLGNIHQPGDTIVIENEELLETKGDKIVLTLTAVYGTEVPKGTITYHATYNDESKEDPTKHDWNSTVTLPSDTFTRKGYEIVGWNKTAAGAEAGTVEFPAGQDAYVSAMSTNIDTATNVGNNDLYAVWQPLVRVEITGKSDTKVYNGSEQSVTGYDVVYYLGNEKQTAAPEGVTVALADGKKAEAKGTNVGEYPMGLTTDSFVLTSTKYNKEAEPVKVTDGRLTITPVTSELTVTVTGNSATKVYNKQTQSVEGFTSDAPATVTVALKEGKTAVASGVNAGTYPMGLTAADFTATSENYTNIKIVVVDGKLTITPITEETEVTVTGNTLTTTYNGNEQSVSGFTTNAADVDSTITVALAEGKKAEAKGTDADTYPMELTEDSFTATSVNYSNIKLKVTDGWLKINPIEDKVTVKIEGNHNTNQYDGAEHTTTGYKVASIDNTLYTEDNISFTGKAEAKRTDEGKTMMNLTKDQFSNTSGNFSNVVFEVTDGYQEITPVDEVVVTITGNKDTKVFNGSEQKVEDYKVEISNPLYKVTDFTFSGTKVAKGTNVGLYPMGLKAEQFTNNNTNFKTVTFNVTDGSLTITKAQAEVTITGNKDSKEYNGAEQQVEGYKVSIDNSLYKEADFTFSGTKVAKGTNVGTYPMGLAVEQFTNNNTNFDVTFKVTDGELEITPVAAEVVVKIAGHKDSKVYDAAEHKVTGYDVTEISNKLYKEADIVFSGKAEAAQTEVGKAQMGLAAAQFSNNNKNFSKVTFDVTDGYQEVTPAKVTVTITGKNHTDVYDGKEHKVTGYDVEIDNKLYKEADFAFSGKAEAAQTEVGKAVMGLKKDQFKNNNKNFEVTFKVTDGYQEITPITDEVVVTIKGDKKTNVYDGKAHTASGYTFESSNPLYKQTDVEFTGTASASRTDVGTTPMGLAESQFKNISKDFSNVKFNVTDGSQEITPLAVTVTITGKNNTTEYDGTEHKVTGYDEKYSSDLYTAKDYTFSGKAEAARTDAGQTDMGLKADQFKNTNDNFTVTFTVTDGYQRITPVEKTVVVKIKGNTNSTDYDGKAHKTEGYTVAEISNPLYKEADFAFSGKAEAERTDAGKTDMGLKADQFKNNNGNFSEVVFEVTDGYQEIKPINVTVTITGHNNTTVYDGKEHKVTGYDVQISNELYKEADFEFSGKAEAAQTEVGKAEMGLKADQFKNNNKNFAEVTFKVTDGYQEVTPVDEVVVTITGHKNTSDYDGKEHTVTGYDVEINNPLYKEADFTFSGKAEAKRTDAGKTDMGLKADQFTNNNKNFAKVTFNVTDGYQEIKPINVTVDITGKTNTTEYDGKEHKVTGYDVKISNELYKEADFTFSGKAEAARTEEGKSMMNLAADQFENTNDNFAVVTFNVTDGYQEITPVADEVVVTITGHNNSTDYDAKEHSVEGYDVEISNKLYTEADFTFTGEAKAARTDAGKTDMGLEQSQFANISKNFAKVRFVVTDGYQEIKPIKAVVTITGHNDTAEYDGKEHVVRGYDVSIDNELYKAADFTFSGTAEAKRTDVGKTDMGLDASQFSNTNKNFSEVTFKVTDGYQEITPFADKVVVTITGKTNTTDYDGKEHVVTGYDVSIDNDLYTEDDFTFNGKDEVKGTDVVRDGKEVGTYPMGLKPTDFENISKNFSDVEFVVEDGSLKINPLPVTIKSADAQKVYDGEELTKHEVTVEGFVEGEGLAAVKVTGTQTYVGSSANTFEYKLFGDSIFRKMLAKIADTDAYKPEDLGVNKITKADNYDITATPGTLTVTDEGVDIDDVATKKHEDKEYKLGDTVEFTIEVVNIYDEKKDITVEEQEGVTITSESEFKDVEPGAKVTVTAKYTVTEKDILAREFNNKATVKFSGVDKPYEPEDKVDVEDPNSHLTVDKKTTSKPANGKTYALGEKITYEVTATNDGNMTLANIEVKDDLTGDAWTVEKLAPGESKTFTAEYTVTEQDIIAGSVKNEATATADPEDPEAPKPEIVPGTTEDPTDESNPHLTIVKETTSTPANGKTYAVGETVTYKITVTNDGNLTVKDVEVKDELTGDLWNVESIAPGEDKVFTAEYTVTEEDAKKGTVTNIATATGTTDDPDHPTPTVEPGTNVVDVEEPEEPEESTGVKTGDDTNIPGAVGGFFAALAGLFGALFVRRRRNSDEA